MSEFAGFQSRAGQKSNDEVHRKRLLKVITTYDNAVTAMKRGQFCDWQQARHLAAQIKDYTLARIPELLEQFEKKIEARGAQVLWAEDKVQAQKFFMEIVERHSARTVVKSKSMMSEELSINELLEHAKIEVVESDLGELIVQLAGEKPYHIVTPAMHKSKAEISELFSRKLGIPATEDAAELTMAARKHLREVYLNAQIGVTGANFLIADVGAVAITENEGNARLSSCCPPVHVVLAGIEKVLPRLADLELFLPLLATSGTGQQLTSYNSVFFGPKRQDEVDGPEFMYVILVDNGRSRLYADRKLQKSLRCIRCGACLNACPVYKSVGGHSYNTAYPGPIGAVITPHLQSLQTWQHLSFASSLCGACTDSCPVEIPLHHLLLENRAQAVQKNSVGNVWSLLLGFWQWIFSSRLILNLLRPVLRVGSWFAAQWALFRGQPRVPVLPNKSFAQLWKEDSAQKLNH